MSVDVTVVIPVHEAEATLDEALASVAAQTRPPGEVLLALNGCTDGSAEIARRYATWDRRFVLLERPEADLVGALNDAVDQARGSLLARLDADDVMAPDRLRLQVEAIERHRDWVGVTSRVRCEAVCGGAPGRGMSRYVDWLNGLTTPRPSPMPGSSTRPSASRP